MVSKVLEEGKPPGTGPSSMPIRPKFNANPEQENREQMQRWSLNTVPSWSYPPLAIANKYHDHQTNQPKSVRYRLILVRASDLEWLRRDRLQDLQAHVTAGHRWIPEQQLPYQEIILYAYAADRTNRPTYVCLPSGLYNARTGRVLAQAGPEQEITPLPGIYFFDGWRVRPALVIPDNLPSTKEAPVWDVEASAHSPASAEPPRSPEEEARNILATAAKNQTEDGPSTRRAAIRACKYLRAMVNQHGPLIQSAHLAAKTHTQRSKSSAAATMQYRPKEGELPVIAPELTSELLHCLSTLPDPWPLAKITIDMEKPSQWVSKICRLFFADEYARSTVGVPTPTQVPDLEPAFKATQNILPKLEARIIEFLSEWLVTFLMPARHLVDTRAPHLYFMFLKEYWFKELYLGLKVTASFERSESYTRIIDGQVRCITPDFKPKELQVAWNVQFITVFVPAWMIPPMYHSLRRESIKNTNSDNAIGVKSIRPTWFEDIVTSREPQSQIGQEQPEPMHGLKLVIKEEALPLKEQPEFPALAELAKRGLLAPDTWSCKRTQISLKVTIDVPMLGKIINRKAPQWSHNAVWNKKYMEPRPGFTLQQLWASSESAIAQKTSPSYEVKDSDIRRAVTALAAVPAATLPDSAFLSALGTPAARMVPPQTGSLAQRAIEEWERNLCENKAVAILERMQAGRPALIKKDGGEMLIAIVLDQERRGRNAHCHCVRSATSGGKSIGGSPQCLHPSHH